MLADVSQAVLGCHPILFRKICALRSHPLLRGRDVRRQPFRKVGSPTTNPATADNKPCEVTGLKFSAADTQAFPVRTFTSIFAESQICALRSHPLPRVRDVIRQPFRARCSPTTNPAIADSKPCQLRALRFRGAFRRLTRFWKKNVDPNGCCGLSSKIEIGLPRASVRAANLQFEFFRAVAQAFSAIDSLVEGRIVRTSAPKNLTARRFQGRRQIYGTWLVTGLNKLLF